MRRLPLISRVIALTLIIAFGLQEISMAAPMSRPLLTARPKPPIALPDSVAMTDGFFNAGASAPLIIFLQDAHTNPSGQLNIARALDQILAHRPISTVYLEAGKGDVSLTDLRAAAPPDARRSIGLSYLKKGLLQGSEYSNLTSSRPFTLWGVENRALYERSLSVYRESARLRPTALAALAKIDRAYTVIRDARFGPDLAEWDRVMRQYQAEKILMTEYADQIFMRLSRFGIADDLYPNLKSLMKLKAKGSKIKRKQLKKAIKELSATTGLFTEIETAETEIGTRLASSEPERRLLEIGRALRWWRSALELRLDSRSYREFCDAPERLAMIGVMGFLNRQILELDKFYEKSPLRDPVLEKALKYATDFYALADRRDRIFWGLMRLRMEARGEKQAVLITGGYHSDHLKKIFRQSGVSYASFIPRVSHETDNVRYERLLLSQESGAGRNIRGVGTGWTRPTIGLLPLRSPGSAEGKSSLLKELSIVDVRSGSRMAGSGSSGWTNLVSAERMAEIRQYAQRAAKAKRILVLMESSKLGEEVVWLPVIGSLLGMPSGGREIHVITNRPELYKPLDGLVSGQRVIVESAAYAPTGKEPYDLFINCKREKYDKLREPDDSVKEIMDLRSAGRAVQLANTTGNSKLSAVYQLLATAGFKTTDPTYVREWSGENIVFVNPHGVTSGGESQSLKQSWISIIVKALQEDPDRRVILNKGLIDEDLTLTHAIAGAVRNAVGLAAFKRFEVRAFTLDELIAFLKREPGSVVTIDTGLYHLARAFGIPSVVISTNKSFDWVPSDEALTLKLPETRFAPSRDGVAVAVDWLRTTRSGARMTKVSADVALIRGAYRAYLQASHEISEIDPLDQYYLRLEFLRDAGILTAGSNVLYPAIGNDILPAGLVRRVVGINYKGHGDRLREYKVGSAIHQRQIARRIDEMERLGFSEKNDRDFAGDVQRRIRIIDQSMYDYEQYRARALRGEADWDVIYLKGAVHWSTYYATSPSTTYEAQPRQGELQVHAIRRTGIEQFLEKATSDLKVGGHVILAAKSDFSAESWLLSHGFEEVFARPGLKDVKRDFDSPDRTFTVNSAGVALIAGKVPLRVFAKRSVLSGVGAKEQLAASRMASEGIDGIDPPKALAVFMSHVLRSVANMGVIVELLKFGIVRDLDDIRYTRENMFNGLEALIRAFEVPGDGAMFGYDPVENRIFIHGVQPYVGSNEAIDRSRALTPEEFRRLTDSVNLGQLAKALQVKKDELDAGLKALLEAPDPATFDTAKTLFKGFLNSGIELANFPFSGSWMAQARRWIADHFRLAVFRVLEYRLLNYWNDWIGIEPHVATTTLKHYLSKAYGEGRVNWLSVELKRWLTLKDLPPDRPSSQVSDESFRERFRLAAIETIRVMKILDLKGELQKTDSDPDKPRDHLIREAVHRALTELDPAAARMADLSAPIVGALALMLAQVQAPESPKPALPPQITQTAPATDPAIALMQKFTEPISLIADKKAAPEARIEALKQLSLLATEALRTNLINLRPIVTFLEAALIIEKNKEVRTEIEKVLEAFKKAAQKQEMREKLRRRHEEHDDPDPRRPWRTFPSTMLASQAPDVTPGARLAKAAGWDSHLPPRRAEAYRRLARQIADRIEKDQPLVLVIDAPSGLGKTVLATAVQEELRHGGVPSGRFGLDLFMRSDEKRARNNAAISRAGKVRTDEYSRVWRPRVLDHFFDTVFAYLASKPKAGEAKMKLIRIKKAFVRKYGDLDAAWLEHNPHVGTDIRKAFAPLKIPLKRQLLIVEGKFVGNIRVLDRYRKRVLYVRMVGDPRRGKSQFMKRYQKTMTKAELGAREKLYRLFTGPSYFDDYEPRTRGRVDLVAHVADRRSAKWSMKQPQEVFAKKASKAGRHPAGARMAEDAGAMGDRLAEMDLGGGARLMLETLRRFEHTAVVRLQVINKMKKVLFAGEFEVDAALAATRDDLASLLRAFAMNEDWAHIVDKLQRGDPTNYFNAMMNNNLTRLYGMRWLFWEFQQWISNHQDLFEGSEVSIIEDHSTKKSSFGWEWKSPKQLVVHVDPSNFDEDKLLRLIRFELDHPPAKRAKLMYYADQDDPDRKEFVDKDMLSSHGKPTFERKRIALGWWLRYSDDTKRTEHIQRALDISQITLGDGRRINMTVSINLVSRTHPLAIMSIDLSWLPLEWIGEYQFMLPIQPGTPANEVLEGLEPAIAALQEKIRQLHTPTAETVGSLFLGLKAADRFDSEGARMAIDRPLFVGDLARDETFNAVPPSARGVLPLVNAAGSGPVVSVGVSTGGEFEILLAKKMQAIAKTHGLEKPRRVFATTLDRAGIQSVRAAIDREGLADLVTVKRQDVSQGFPDQAKVGTDLIYARLVYHYLNRQQLAAVFQQMKKVLVPGGKVYIVVKSADDFWCREAMNVRGVEKLEELRDPGTWMVTYAYPDGKSFSRQFFTPETLRQYVEEAGDFAVDEIKPMDEMLYRDFERTQPDDHESALLVMQLTYQPLAKFAAVAEDLDKLLTEINAVWYQKLPEGTEPVPPPDMPVMGKTTDPRFHTFADLEKVVYALTRLDDPNYLELKPIMEVLIQKTGELGRKGPIRTYLRDRLNTLSKKENTNISLAMVLDRLDWLIRSYKNYVQSGSSDLKGARMAKANSDAGAEDGKNSEFGFERRKPAALLGVSGAMAEILEILALLEGSDPEQFNDLKRDLRISARYRALMDSMRLQIRWKSVETLKRHDWLKNMRDRLMRERKRLEAVLDRSMGAEQVSLSGFEEQPRNIPDELNLINFRICVLQLTIAGMFLAPTAQNGILGIDDPKIQARGFTQSLRGAASSLARLQIDQMSRDESAATNTAAEAITSQPPLRSEKPDVGTTPSLKQTQGQWLKLGSTLERLRSTVRRYGRDRQAAGQVLSIADQLDQIASIMTGLSGDRMRLLVSAARNVLKDPDHQQALSSFDLFYETARLELGAQALQRLYKIAVTRTYKNKASLVRGLTERIPDNVRAQIPKLNGWILLVKSLRAMFMARTQLNRYEMNYVRKSVGAIREWGADGMVPERQATGAAAEELFALLQNDSWTGSEAAVLGSLESSLNALLKRRDGQRDIRTFVDARATRLKTPEGARMANDPDSASAAQAAMEGVIRGIETKDPLRWSEEDLASLMSVIRDLVEEVYGKYAGRGELPVGNWIRGNVAAGHLRQGEWKKLESQDWRDCSANILGLAGLGDSRIPALYFKALYLAASVQDHLAHKDKTRYGPAARYHLAVVWLESIQSYAAVDYSASNDVEFVTRLATSLYHNGDYHRGRQLFEDLIRRGAADRKITAGLGTVLLKPALELLKDFRSALKDHRFAEAAQLKNLIFDSTGQAIKWFERNPDARSLAGMARAYLIRLDIQMSYLEHPQALPEDPAERQREIFYTIKIALLALDCIRRASDIAAPGTAAGDGSKYQQIWEEAAASAQAVLTPERLDPGTWGSVDIDLLAPKVNALLARAALAGNLQSQLSRIRQRAEILKTVRRIWKEDFAKALGSDASTTLEALREQTLIRIEARFGETDRSTARRDAEAVLDPFFAENGLKRLDITDLAILRAFAIVGEPANYQQNVPEYVWAQEMEIPEAVKVTEEIIEERSTAAGSIYDWLGYVWRAPIAKTAVSSTAGIKPYQKGEVERILSHDQALLARALPKTGEPWERIKEWISEDEIQTLEQAQSVRAGWAEFRAKILEARVSKDFRTSEASLRVLKINREISGQQSLLARMNRLEKLSQNVHRSISDRVAAAAQEITGLQARALDLHRRYGLTMMSEYAERLEAIRGRILAVLSSENGAHMNFGYFMEQLELADQIRPVVERVAGQESQLSAIKSRMDAIDSVTRRERPALFAAAWKKAAKDASGYPRAIEEAVFLSESEDAVRKISDGLNDLAGRVNELDAFEHDLRGWQETLPRLEKTFKMHRKSLLGMEADFEQFAGSIEIIRAATQPDRFSRKGYPGIKKDMGADRSRVQAAIADAEAVLRRMSDAKRVMLEPHIRVLSLQLTSALDWADKVLKEPRFHNQNLRDEDDQKLVFKATELGKSIKSAREMIKDLGRLLRDPGAPVPAELDEMILSRFLIQLTNQITALLQLDIDRSRRIFKTEVIRQLLAADFKDGSALLHDAGGVYATIKYTDFGYPDHMDVDIFQESLPPDPAVRQLIGKALGELRKKIKDSVRPASFAAWSDWSDGQGEFPAVEMLQVVCMSLLYVGIWAKGAIPGPSTTPRDLLQSASAEYHQYSTDLAEQEGFNFYVGEGVTGSLRFLESLVRMNGWLDRQFSDATMVDPDPVASKNARTVMTAIIGSELKHRRGESAGARMAHGETTVRLQTILRAHLDDYEAALDEVGAAMERSGYKFHAIRKVWSRLAGYRETFGFNKAFEGYLGSLFVKETKELLLEEEFWRVLLMMTPGQNQPRLSPAEMTRMKAVFSAPDEVDRLLKRLEREGKLFLDPDGSVRTDLDVLARGLESSVGLQGRSYRRERLGPDQAGTNRSIVAADLSEDLYVTGMTSYFGRSNFHIAAKKYFIKKFTADPRAPLRILIGASAFGYQGYDLAMAVAEAKDDLRQQGTEVAAPVTLVNTDGQWASVQFAKRGLYEKKNIVGKYHDPAEPHYDERMLGKYFSRQAGEEPLYAIKDRREFLSRWGITLVHEKFDLTSRSDQQRMLSYGPFDLIVAINIHFKGLAHRLFVNAARQGVPGEADSAEPDGVYHEHLPFLEGARDLLSETGEFVTSEHMFANSRSAIKYREDLERDINFIKKYVDPGLHDEYWIISYKANLITFLMRNRNASAEQITEAAHAFGMGLDRSFVLHILRMIPLCDALGVGEKDRLFAALLPVWARWEAVRAKELGPRYPLGSLTSVLSEDPEKVRIDLFDDLRIRLNGAGLEKSDRFMITHAESIKRTVRTLLETIRTQSVASAATDGTGAGARMSKKKISAAALAERMRAEIDRVLKLDSGQPQMITQKDLARALGGSDREWVRRVVKTSQGLRTQLSRANKKLARTNEEKMAGRLREELARIDQMESPPQVSIAMLSESLEIGRNRFDRFLKKKSSVALKTRIAQTAARANNMITAAEAVISAAETAKTTAAIARLKESGLSKISRAVFGEAMGIGTDKATLDDYFDRYPEFRQLIKTANSEIKEAALEKARAQTALKRTLKAAHVPRRRPGVTPIEELRKREKQKLDEMIQKTRDAIVRLRAAYTPWVSEKRIAREAGITTHQLTRAMTVDKKNAASGKPPIETLPLDREVHDLMAHSRTLIPYKIDCYALLGVPFDATAKEITDAFKARMKESHPNALLGQPAPRDDSQSHMTYLDRIGMARDVLRTPDLREKYDPYYVGHKRFDKVIRVIGEFLDAPDGPGADILPGGKIRRSRVKREAIHKELRGRFEQFANSRDSELNKFIDFALVVLNKKLTAENLIPFEDMHFRTAGIPSADKDHLLNAPTSLSAKEGSGARMAGSERDKDIMMMQMFEELGRAYLRAGYQYDDQNVLRPTGTLSGEIKPDHAVKFDNMFGGEIIFESQDDPGSEISFGLGEKDESSFSTRDGMVLRGRELGRPKKKLVMLFYNHRPLLAVATDPSGKVYAIVKQEVIKAHHDAKFKKPSLNQFPVKILSERSRLIPRLKIIARSDAWISSLAKPVDDALIAKTDRQIYRLTRAVKALRKEMIKTGFKTIRQNVSAVLEEYGQIKRRPDEGRAIRDLDRALIGLFVRAGADAVPFVIDAFKPLVSGSYSTYYSLGVRRGVLVRALVRIGLPAVESICKALKKQHLLHAEAIRSLAKALVQISDRHGLAEVTSRVPKKAFNGLAQSRPEIWLEMIVDLSLHGGIRYGFYHLPNVYKNADVPAQIGGFAVNQTLKHLLRNATANAIARFSIKPDRATIRQTMDLLCKKLEGYLPGVFLGPETDRVIVLAGYGSSAQAAEWQKLALSAGISNDRITIIQGVRSLRGDRQLRRKALDQVAASDGKTVLVFTGHSGAASLALHFGRKDREDIGNRDLVISLLNRLRRNHQSLDNVQIFLDGCDVSNFAADLHRFLSDAIAVVADSDGSSEPLPTALPVIFTTGTLHQMVSTESYYAGPLLRGSGRRSGREIRIGDLFEAADEGFGEQAPEIYVSAGRGEALEAFVRAQRGGTLPLSHRYGMLVTDVDEALPAGSARPTIFEPGDRVRAKILVLLRKHYGRPRDSISDFYMRHQQQLVAYQRRFNLGNRKIPKELEYLTEMLDPVTGFDGLSKIERLWPFDPVEAQENAFRSLDHLFRVKGPADLQNIWDEVIDAFLPFTDVRLRGPESAVYMPDAEGWHWVLATSMNGGKEAIGLLKKELQRVGNRGSRHPAEPSFMDLEKIAYSEILLEGIFLARTHNVGDKNAKIKALQRALKLTSPFVQGLAQAMLSTDLQKEGVGAADYRILKMYRAQMVAHRPDYGSAILVPKVDLILPAVPTTAATGARMAGARDGLDSDRQLLSLWQSNVTSGLVDPVMIAALKGRRQVGPFIVQPIDITTKGRGVVLDPNSGHFENFQKLLVPRHPIQSLIRIARYLHRRIWLKPALVTRGGNGIDRLAIQNMPPHQKVMRWQRSGGTRSWVVSANPYPCFDPHLVLASGKAEPQRLDRPAIADIIDRAGMDSWTVFFNGIGGGSSIEDHLHLQIAKAALPINDEDRNGLEELHDLGDGVRVYAVRNYPTKEKPRTVLSIAGRNRQKLEEQVDLLYRYLLNRGHAISLTAHKRPTGEIRINFYKIQNEFPVGPSDRMGTLQAAGWIASAAKITDPIRAEAQVINIIHTLMGDLGPEAEEISRSGINLISGGARMAEGGMSDERVLGTDAGSVDRWIREWRERLTRRIDAERSKSAWRRALGRVMGADPLQEAVEDAVQGARGRGLVFTDAVLRRLNEIVPQQDPDTSRIVQSTEDIFHQTLRTQLSTSGPTRREFMKQMTALAGASMTGDWKRIINIGFAPWLQITSEGGKDAVLRWVHGKFMSSSQSADTEADRLARLWNQYGPEAMARRFNLRSLKRDIYDQDRYVIARLELTGRQTEAGLRLLNPSLSGMKKAIMLMEFGHHQHLEAGDLHFDNRPLLDESLIADKTREWRDEFAARIANLPADYVASRIRPPAVDTPKQSIGPNGSVESQNNVAPQTSLMDRSGSVVRQSTVVPADLTVPDLEKFSGDVVKAQPAALANGEAQLSLEFANEKSTWLKVWRDGALLKVEVFGETLTVDPSKARQHETVSAPQISGPVRVSAEEWMELQRIVMEASQKKLDLKSIPDAADRGGVVLHLNGLAGTGQLQQSRLQTLAAEAARSDENTAILLQGDEPLKSAFREMYQAAKGRAKLADISEAPADLESGAFSHILSRSEWGGLAVKVSRPVVLEDIKEEGNKTPVHVFAPVLREAEALSRIRSIDAQSSGLQQIYVFHQSLMGTTSGSFENYLSFLEGTGSADLFTLPALARISISEAVRFFALAARLSRQSA